MTNLTLQESLARSANLTLFRCGDMRFNRGSDRDKMIAFLDQQYGPGIDFDEQSVPGGPIALITGNIEEQRLMLEHISVYISAHQPETVLALFHTTCARIRQLFEPATLEDETKLIMQKAPAVVDWLQRRFSNVTVRAALACMEGRHLDHIEIIGAGSMSVLHPDSPQPSSAARPF